MKTLHLILLIAALLLAGACAPTYNATPSQPALFNGAGQAKISGSFSGSAGSLQGGVALTDNFAVISSLNAFSNSYSLTIGSTTTTESSRGTNLDILPGYYTTFGNVGVLECFAGYGIGSVNSPEYVGTLHKLYLQPSMGWKANLTEGALTLRITDLILSDFNTPGTSSAIFVEPSFTFRFGGPRLKGITQFGFSLPLGEGPVASRIEFNPFLINVGLQYQITE